MANMPSATDSCGATKSEGTSGQQAATGQQAVAGQHGTMQHSVWQSTIWKNENGTWKAVYHQVTPSFGAQSSENRSQK
jgi:hypothetical protein